MSDDDSQPCASTFFSRRSKIGPKKSAEDLKAAEEMLSEIMKEEAAENVERKKKGRKKKHPGQSAETVDNLDDIDNVVLSPSAKKRLRKLRKDQKDELKRIEEENQKIFSDMDNSEFPKFNEEPEEIVEDSIHLTVVFISKVARFKCLKNENFTKVFLDVANFFKIKPTEFLLCHKDRNIVVDDTPESLSLTATDILECIPYKSTDVSQKAAESDGNSLKITFQSNDSKIKIDLFAHKLEKMKTVMEQYSTKRDLSLKNLLFEFDGQKLLGSETAMDLDMESGSCVDVKVIQAKDCEIESEEGQIEDDESVITVNSESDDSEIAILD